MDTNYYLNPGYFQQYNNPSDPGQNFEKHERIQLMLNDCEKYISHLSIVVEQAREVTEVIKIGDDWSPSYAEHMNDTHAILKAELVSKQAGLELMKDQTRQSPEGIDVVEADGDVFADWATYIVNPIWRIVPRLRDYVGL